MKSIFTYSTKLFTFFLVCLFGFSTVVAQTVPPPSTSCSSKDLELVGATLTGGDLCNSCPPNTTLTRTLTLSINNKTGSTRTSFAFWGTLEIYSGVNGSLISSTTITGCNGPLPPNSITSLSFNQINYTCGDILKITNLFLAWTSSSPGSTCPLDPNDISPKCGTLPSIAINSGVNGLLVGPNLQCFGSNTGAIDLTPMGGTAPYTYDWTDIPGTINSEDRTGLAAGTYTVTITDTNGCTITKSTTITQPAVLNATVAKTNATCNGANDGTISVSSPTGGNGTFEYRLDSGTWQTSGNFTGLAAATYSVQIRDAAHPTCVIVLGDQIITQPAVLSATVAKTNTTCNGANDGTISVSSPSGGYGTFEYRLNSGTWQTSGNFTGLAAATYSVQIRDAAHTACVKVLGDQIITQPAVLSATVAKTNVTCNDANDGTISVSSPSGGYGTFEYRLDSGTWQTSGNFTSLAPATYSVQIRDAAHPACVIVLGDQTITQPAVLSASVAKTNVTCNDANDGTISVSSPSGGYGTFEYRLDSGTWQTSGNFTGLAAATYSVQIRDAAHTACVKVLGDQIITQPAVLSATVAKTNVTCNDANDGTISVSSPSGGYGTFEYRLDSGTWQTSGNFTGLAPATYSVQIRDAAHPACVIVLGDQIINQPAVLTCSITQNKAVSANGLSDGQATITPLGGNGGYTYLWDNGETTAQAIALNAGPHSVTVTDSKECQTTCEITITEPNVLSCSIAQDTPAKCYGDSNGIATVTAIGGNGDYTYLWDNEETTAQATALNAGTHTVTVTDKLGYKTTCSVIITQPDAAISATATITNNNNCVGCSNGAIDLTVSGGTIPYTFLWSNEAITEDISNLPKGNYAVEIKDKNGCTANYTFEITESGIALVKTGVFSDTNNDGFAQVGEIINYTFAVTNTGNVTVTNIVITDLDFEGLTISNSPINSLAPGATDSSVTGTYTITQTDIDAGKVTNSALATGKDPKGNDVTDISGTTVENNTPTDTPLPQKPEIALVKTGVFVDENNDGYAQVGETINYTFAVTNTGNVTVTNIIITDPLITVVGGPIGTLAVGATDNTTITASYPLTQADIDAGQVTNVATATGQDPDGKDVSHTDDTTVDLTDFQKPEITLVKTGVFVDENKDGYAQVGETINYTFAVTNTGNVTLTNIVITDPLVTVVGGSIATLAVGATDNTTITASYPLTQADIDASQVTNIATATGQDPKGNDVTHTVDTTVDLTNFQKPDIALVKTGVFSDTNNDGFAQVDEIINYTFAVTNTGNVTLTNIVITDPLVTVVGGPISTLAVGATDNTTVTATYTITQADIDAGKVTNSALATGKDPKGNDVTDISGTTVENDTPTDTPLPQTPGIALVKTGVFSDTNNDGFAQVGEIINYTFAVTNTGNVIVTNIVITDPLIGLIITGNPIASLAPGATNNSVTGVYTVTQADIDAGKVTNSALASGKDPKGNDVTDISGTTVENDTPTDTPLPQTPSIALVKTGVFSDTNNDGFPQVGEKINYTFAVTNTGNVVVTNIVITDLVPLVGLIISGNPIASLAPGATNNSVTGIYSITQADIDAGRVTNSALATGKDPKGNDVTDISGTTVENNTPTVTPLTQNPRLEVTKNATTTEYSLVGDIINYTIQVKNTGNVTLHQIIVTDPLTGLNTTIESLTPGSSSQVFPQSYTIIKNDLTIGSVTNTATANGLTPDGNHIIDTDTVTVDKALVLGCGTILVHNAFSPNGDGINEKFTIDNINDINCYPDNTVEIYNRWGVLVFETRNYNNDSNFFDGISKGRTTISQSSGLPTGTYYYILNYTSVDLNGDIHTNKKDGYLYLTR